MSVLENRRLTAIVALAYAVFFAWFSLVGPFRPIANWDMFPYVGAAYSLTKAPHELRALALSDLRRYVTDEQYRAITGGSVFRETVAREDGAFLEQLWLYKAKPLYVLLTGLVGAVVGNMAMATVMVSAAGFFLIGLALYLLRPDGVSGAFYLAAVAAASYAGTPQLVTLAQASTPDLLAAGLFLLGLAALIKKGHVALTAILFSLAVMTRQDHAIPVLLLVPLLLEMRKDRFVSTPGALAIVGIPVGVFTLTKMFGPQYGVVTVLSYAIFDPPLYGAIADVSAVANAYLPRVIEDLKWLVSLPRFVLFIATSVVVLLTSRDIYAKWIVLAAIGNVIAKILIFPHPDGGNQERYFFLSYFLLLIALFRALGARTVSRA